MFYEKPSSSDALTQSENIKKNVLLFFHIIYVI